MLYMLCGIVHGIFFSQTHACLVLSSCSLQYGMSSACVLRSKRARLIFIWYSELFPWGESHNTGLAERPRRKAFSLCHQSEFHVKNSQMIKHVSSLSDRLSHLNLKSKCYGVFFPPQHSNKYQAQQGKECVTALHSTNSSESSFCEHKRKRFLALCYSSTIAVILYCSLSVLIFPLNVHNT